jgi:hypothetical protein
LIDLGVMGPVAPNIASEGALILTISTPMEAPLSQLQFNGLPELAAPQQLIFMDGSLLLLHMPAHDGQTLRLPIASMNTMASKFLTISTSNYKDLCKEDQFSERHCVKSLRICVF